MGSSGSFTTALLRGLYAYTKGIIHPNELAEKACHIEMDLLGESIGKQDQYAAAFGVFNLIEFNSDDSVSVEPIICKRELGSP